jgi:hypothetical protein
VAIYDGCRVRSTAAGEPCSVSLMPKENSLFRRIISLFRRKFSLFDCVGNSIKKGNQYGRLGRCLRADNARIRENSLYFPWISGNPSAENGSLVTVPTATMLHRLSG